MTKWVIACGHLFQPAATRLQILIFTAFIVFLTTTSTFAQRTNLAQGRPAAASSEENHSTDGFLAAGNAVDGNMSTRWGSLFGASHWISVDLGQTYLIDSVFLAWEAAGAVRYTVEVSVDNISWSPAADITNGTGGQLREISFNSIDARHIRINCTERVTIEGNKYGYSLYELQVFEVETDTTMSISAADMELAAGGSTLITASFFDKNDLPITGISGALVNWSIDQDDLKNGDELSASIGTSISLTAIRAHRTVEISAEYTGGDKAFTQSITINIVPGPASGLDILLDSIITSMNSYSPNWGVTIYGDGNTMKAYAAIRDTYGNYIRKASSAVWSSSSSNILNVSGNNTALLTRLGPGTAKAMVSQAGLLGDSMTVNLDSPVSPAGNSGYRCDLVMKADQCADFGALEQINTTLPVNTSRIKENGMNICLPPDLVFNQPIDVVIVVDHSSSMTWDGHDPTFQTSDAVKRTIDTLLARAPESNVGYMGFAKGISTGIFGGYFNGPMGAYSG